MPTSCDLTTVKLERVLSVAVAVRVVPKPCCRADHVPGNRNMVQEVLRTDEQHLLDGSGREDVQPVQVVDEGLFSFDLIDRRDSHRGEDERTC